jgi:hypothetical protein
VKCFAPGQFTERGTGFGWSLGAVLGYEVWRASGTSASITGNGFETWNEPGIVWVQRDDNGNGLPDEMWYEIKGSDDTGTYKDNITWRYALTYYRDQLAETTPNQFEQIIRTIYWVDQRGRIGTLGGGWPSPGNTAGIQGESGDWMTYTGTILRDSKGEKLNLGQANLAPISGYVDVMSGGSQTLTFSVNSAIRADGTPAGLSGFSFIKVQTAYFEYGDAFGERSTEIVSATGLGKN